MRIRMRPYGGQSGRRRMADLVHAHPAGNIHIADLPYRLSSWAFDDPGNIGLWEDGAGNLLAWAVLQTPFWAIDYAYHPAARDYGIHPMILTWAVVRAQAVVGKALGRRAWFVSVRADQADLQGDLERAGFVRQADWSQVIMERPTDTPVPPAVLPEGFTVRPLAGLSEVEAYAEVHCATFGSPNMTAEWRARTLAQPEYLPDLDLVVVAPDGRLTAFCVGWLDPLGQDGPVIGQVEPLGVHPDFQGRGLGGVAGGPAAPAGPRRDPADRGDGYPPGCRLWPLPIGGLPGGARHLGLSAGLHDRRGLMAGESQDGAAGQEHQHDQRGHGIARLPAADEVQ